EGNAYHCYCTPEELEQMRAEALAAGRQPRYDGRWRDRDPSEAPAGVRPVIRLKAPREGQTVIKDLVQGDVVIANEQLDD
ncbi:glutamate--tRNA ligase family protein, partial [Acinetobacter baumannii]